MKTFVVITLLTALAVAGPTLTRPTQAPPTVLATPEARVCTRICASESFINCGEGWVW
ncbi:hypothetical protein B0T12DRAFT_404860 [Alternaria alternata]|jgi:hypothetical protein|nr:hypothetical protein B0T12DRAFT_404860 [Alternaria alternata]